MQRLRNCEKQKRGWATLSGGTWCTCLPMWIYVPCTDRFRKICVFSDLLFSHFIDYSNDPLMIFFVQNFHNWATNHIWLFAPNISSGVEHFVKNCISGAPNNLPNLFLCCNDINNESFQEQIVEMLVTHTDSFTVLSG